MIQLPVRGTADDRRVWVSGELLDPKPSQEVHNHSPDGFNWGYQGSGPAQLSLAIMMKLYPKSIAYKLYQDFKRNHICKIKHGHDFNEVLEIKADDLKRLVGQEVTYTGVAGKKENGIIKSIHETALCAYVVFHCGGNWENYEEYTSMLVDIKDLELGWVEEDLDEDEIERREQQIIDRLIN